MVGAYCNASRHRQVGKTLYGVLLIYMVIYIREYIILVFNA